MGGPKTPSHDDRPTARKLAQSTSAVRLAAMKVTALEIQQKQFRRVFRGLDPQEVRSFLDQVAASTEEAAAEIIRLHEELRRKEERIAELTSREKLIEETLLTAQRLSDELEKQARKEAELILADAERRGEEVVQQANERLVGILGQIAEMKRQRALFESQLRQAAEAQLRLLDLLASDPAPIEAAKTTDPQRAAGGV